MRPLAMMNYYPARLDGLAGSGPSCFSQFGRVVDAWSHTYGVPLTTIRWSAVSLQMQFGCQPWTGSPCCWCTCWVDLS